MPVNPALASRLAKIVGEKRVSFGPVNCDVRIRCPALAIT